MSLTNKDEHKKVKGAQLSACIEVMEAYNLPDYWENLDQLHEYLLKFKPQTLDKEQRNDSRRII